MRSRSGDEGGGLLLSLRSWLKLRFLRVWWVSRFHLGQSMLFFRRGIVPVVGLELGMELGWHILEGIVEVIVFESSKS